MITNPQHQITIVADYQEQVKKSYNLIIRGGTWAQSVQGRRGNDLDCELKGRKSRSITDTAMFELDL
ncbi:hypothetical protein HMPREF9429_00958 [Megasphaera micronuciformis F0359]|uniref:Uncharacterized protein n=1 Tax=Megasphaera micronuciformis F0359 TaxID=706434 RepID=E2ZCK7_9FIRM|nr:hypothetical protein HMPREF9429_00958 [Megasphaera micronuciformis F0359]